jgi:hypothetical protein
LGETMKIFILFHGFGNVGDFAFLRVRLGFYGRLFLVLILLW